VQNATPPAAIIVAGEVVHGAAGFPERIFPDTPLIPELLLNASPGVAVDGNRDGA
jgi:hypothetical protein